MVCVVCVVLCLCVFVCVVVYVCFVCDVLGCGVWLVFCVVSDCLVMYGVCVCSCAVKLRVCDML